MERKGDVKISHHEFKQIMREYAQMAVETGNSRLSAKCASICLNEVVTSVTSGDDSKSLCYKRDIDYISIARSCIK
tara:strand:+ start:370 stop:597 length:228 start_codon:yes stop_codon:yes gene_type:complete